MEIPGFVYDPATNRYFKKVKGQSEQSSSSQKVMQRITVTRHVASRSKKRKQKQRHQGGGGSGSGAQQPACKHHHNHNHGRQRGGNDNGGVAGGELVSTPLQRRLCAASKDFNTVGRLLLHRECGNLPGRGQSVWPRLCYESERGVELRVARGVQHAWWFETLGILPQWGANGRRLGMPIHTQQQQRQQQQQGGRSAPCHFTALLSTTAEHGGYLWSRGATDRVVSDDILVCTRFASGGERGSAGTSAPAAMAAMANWSGPASHFPRGGGQAEGEGEGEGEAALQAEHTLYRTHSPAIHACQVRPYPGVYLFGFMGSGNEPGNIRVARGLSGRPVTYSAGGTVWTAQHLLGPLCSIGEREGARVLALGEASIESVFRLRYPSDVLAQACIEDKHVMVHGLRNGQIHLADWRAPPSRSQQASRGRLAGSVEGSEGPGRAAKAGRSITELVSVPGDPHQFAVLGYCQLPRLWDVRMGRALVKCV